MAKKDHNNDNDATLARMEQTLVAMFDGNAAIYEQNEEIENRKDFRRIATELTSAILDVRRQRLFESGAVDHVRTTTAKEYTRRNISKRG